MRAGKEQLTHAHHRLYGDRAVLDWTAKPWRRAQLVFPGPDARPRTRCTTCSGTMSDLAGVHRVAMRHAGSRDVARLAIEAGRRSTRAVTPAGVRARAVDEIERLHAVGHPDALGAASWLGRPGLTAGAPADLQVRAEDPRRDAVVLRYPELIMLRGRVVSRPTEQPAETVARGRAGIRPESDPVFRLYRV